MPTRLLVIADLLAAKHFTILDREIQCILRRTQRRTNLYGRGQLQRTPRDDFSHLVEPHVPQLLRTARAILGSDDLAWDAVQEALLSLWKEERPPAQLHGWLRRTVVHRSRHLLRTNLRRNRHESHAATCQCETCRRDDPAHLLEGRELQTSLAGALAKLPESHRQVFLLREMEQLDYEEIAKRLQVPVGTVRSRLNRSRAMLREALRPATD